MTPRLRPECRCDSVIHEVLTVHPAICWRGVWDSRAHGRQPVTRLDNSASRSHYNHHLDSDWRLCPGQGTSQTPPDHPASHARVTVHYSEIKPTSPTADSAPDCLPFRAVGRRWPPFAPEM